MDRCEEMLFIPLITLVLLSYTQGNTFQPVSSTCIYWDSLTRYTNGEEQKLHCILDENGIEGLVNTTWKLIVPGFCPIFNRHSKDIDSEVCDNDLGRCPDIHIRSYQATQYNACYGKARQGGRSGTEFKEQQPSQEITNHYYGNTAGTEFKEQQPSQEITNHYYGNTNRIHLEVAVVILVLLLILFLGVIAYLVYLIRKERKKSRNISQGNLGADEAVTLVLHSNTEGYVHFKHENDNGSTEDDYKVPLVSMESQMDREEYDRLVPVKYDDIVFMLEKFTNNRVEEFKNGNKDACEALKPNDGLKLAKHLTKAVMQKCDIDNCYVIKNASNEGTPRLRNEGIQNGDRVQLKFNFTVEEKIGADDTVPLVQHSNTEEYEHLKYKNFNDIAFMLEKVTNKRVEEFKNGNSDACETLKPDNVSKLQNMTNAKV